MGPLGHFSVGLAAKPAARKVPLGGLLLATWILDLLAISFGYAGFEGGQVGNPWSHGLFMSVVWSVAFGLLTTRIYRDRRAGVVVGLLVFSHWVLDFVSHPIPFPSFSWRSWQWSYGHPLPADLPLLLGSSPKVGLGLYNSISAVDATVLEFGMFVVGAAVYARFIVKRRRELTTAVSESPKLRDKSSEPSPVSHPQRGVAMRKSRIVAIIALMFLGLSGVIGAIPLILNQGGEPWSMPQSLLRYSPFRSYLVPGIILLVANGLLSVWALWLTVSRRPGYGWWVIVQGVVLLGWLIVEVAMLRLMVWPHYLYGAVAMALVISGIAIVRHVRQGAAA